jgi:hypothetical protein
MGELPGIKKIAREFGIRPCRAEKIVSEIMEYGLLEGRPNGCLAERKYCRSERTPTDIVLLRMQRLAERLFNGNHK